MRIPIKIQLGDSAILDMFKDEGISIRSVVKDMSDPKKLFTDYSRSFTVPATKLNNRVFQHKYRVDIQSDLDSRDMISAKILMNNVVYKVGNVRVDGARMKNGVAVHYKITFIGKLSELSRRIGKERLNVLDFSSFDDNNFNYKTEIQNTAKRDLMFPISSREQRFLADTTTSSLGIDGSRNIAYSTTVSSEDYGIRERDIVGAMSVGAIIDKIEERYDFSFTGVFESAYIRDLYLWLHQTDKDRNEDLNNALAINYAYNGATNDNFTVVSNGFIYDPTEGTSLMGDKRRFHIRVKGTWSGDATVRLISGGDVVREVSTSGNYTDTYLVFGYHNARIFQVEVEGDFSGTADVDVQILQYDKEITSTSVISGGFETWVFKSTHLIEADATLGSAKTYSATRNIPTMTIMEFLSSLFKMYNIVAEVDSDLNISTKHFDHFMSEGEVKDITEYVDANEYDVSKPNLYSSIIMGFEEPSLALEEAYKSVNGRNYGELSYELRGFNGNKLSGQQYSLKVKNQRSPLEPLDDLSDGSDFRVCYALFSDLGGSEQSTKPMFTYIVKPDDTTGSISEIAFYDNSFVSGTTTYTMPSNIYSHNQTSPVGLNSGVGLFFGEELSEYRYSFSMNGNGLWNSFYRGTTALMFDEDKRQVTLKAHLPQGVLLDLKLSDVLNISNRFYYINELETNYLTGVTKMKLTLVSKSRITEFNNAERSVVNSSSTDSLYITYLSKSTGLIERKLIAPSSNFDVEMVGTVIGFSGADFTDDLT